MIKHFRNIIILIILTFSVSANAQEVSDFSISKDTSYAGIASTKILQMLMPSKAPFVTLQINLLGNVGLFDLAGNNNTLFSKGDFEAGRDFGTRYGIGVNIVTKIRLQKSGNARLLVSGAYNYFSSTLIIPESPEGSVHYNMFSAGLGIENNFNPDRKFKPYVSLEILANFIKGKAELKTDTSVSNLDIKNAVRIGGALDIGFEYAFNNSYGINLGVKLTHANVFLKDSKVSTNPNEIYLNDKNVTQIIPYSNWKQFVFISFHTGFNFYFGGKFRR